MGIPHIIYLVRKMRQINKLTVDEIKAIQLKRLKNIVRYAMEHSAFYKEFYKGINPDNFQLTDLPVLTKKTMMKNYDELVTDKRLKREEIEKFMSEKSNIGKRYLNQFIVLHTSGTTGEMATIAYHWKEFENIQAVNLARGTDTRITPKNLYKYFRNPFRLAGIVMTGGHFPAYTAVIQTPPFTSLFVNLKIFSILTPIQELVQQLNEFQPGGIYSYPTVLETLAYEQLKGKLRINVNVPDGGIAAMSEPLSERTRELVRQAFNVEVSNAYGTSESLIMARDCRQYHNLHLYSDLVIVEVVDHNYKPVPVGEAGARVLLTNLYNYSQPIIRYDVNDVIAISEKPCPCGLPFPYIKRIEGRTEDIVWVKADDGTYHPIHPYVFLGLLVNVKDAKEYQVRQTKPDEILIKIVPFEEKTVDQNSLKREFQQMLDNMKIKGKVQLIIEITDHIPRDPRSGKFRQVLSQVSPPLN